MEIITRHGTSVAGLLLLVTFKFQFVGLSVRRLGPLFEGAVMPKGMTGGVS